LNKQRSTSPQSALRGLIEPRRLTLAQTIFFSEHPGALRRDYPAPKDQVRVLREMDHAFATAEREQPLEWRGYRVRARRREHVGTERAAAMIVAFKQLAARAPELPPTPRS
jgi:hypothetical protein